MKNAIVIVPLIWSLFGPSYPLLAADSSPSVAESTKETAKDAKKTVRKGVRKAKDKTCELVNGKMECAAKKLKHGVENVGDEVSDKVDDIKK